jgi:hypothetical protein
VFSILASGEVVNELPFPGILFGVIAFTLFLILGAVTWSFRDVANRHSHKSSGTGASH